jgi:hypothetical protein
MKDANSFIQKLTAQVEKLTMHGKGICESYNL